MGEKPFPEAMPTVLLASSDPEAPKWLDEASRGELQIQQIAPCDLGNGSFWVDAPVAVAHLRDADGPAALDALLALRELPLAERIVLVSDLSDSTELARGLDQLQPVAWLPDPPPTPALKRALRLAMPTQPGAGARRGQRPIQALLGVSAALREVTDEIQRIAPTQTSVLILGETGTGKELAARAVHEQSLRASGPFVAINCAALPETLLESELFGSKKGSFTGSDRDRTGLFEQADGGTLFLDEIGDTTPALQTKLLRVLEEREVRAVGSSESRAVDVRIVSATHRDLPAAIESGEFRQDLYYRLNTLTLVLPPLRRRRVDIPFLAQHFAEAFGEENARQITLSEEFLDALASYEFPGNVRELRNAVERAIALTGPGEDVLASALQPRQGPTEPPGGAGRGSLREQVERLEVELIRRALSTNEGNKTRAAEDLGLSRVGLGKKIKRYGL
ncbi:MAG: sigma 54-interacting transcriptional regulator [Deltaproteobacteria bacterium]|nr:sigma 54-interacting transcriptional regulator [Deltaproteobacteria bacterium]